jgi:hypothetical protein
MKHNEGDLFQEYVDVTRDKLSDAWSRFIRVPRPRTGIEVVSDGMGDDGVRRIAFRDLRHGELSAPWRADELKEGSVREYAARMHELDTRLDENSVRWWGNLGYLRPMRSQVDLVYRDEDGLDHIFYAARREELRDEWAQLLAQWPDEVNRVDEPSGQRDVIGQGNGVQRLIALARGEKVDSMPRQGQPVSKTNGRHADGANNVPEYVRPWSRPGRQRPGSSNDLHTDGAVSATGAVANRSASDERASYVTDAPPVPERVDE